MRLVRSGLIGIACLLTAGAAGGQCQEDQDRERVVQELVKKGIIHWDATRKLYVISDSPPRAPAAAIVSEPRYVVPSTPITTTSVANPPGDLTSLIIQSAIDTSVMKSQISALQHGKADREDLIPIRQSIMDLRQDVDAHKAQLADLMHKVASTHRFTEAQAVTFASRLKDIEAEARAGRLTAERVYAWQEWLARVDRAIYVQPCTHQVVWTPARSWYVQPCPAW